MNLREKNETYKHYLKTKEPICTIHKLYLPDFLNSEID